MGTLNRTKHMTVAHLSWFSFAQGESRSEQMKVTADTEDSHKWKIPRDMGIDRTACDKSTKTLHTSAAHTPSRPGEEAIRWGTNCLPIKWAQRHWTHSAKEGSNESGKQKEGGGAVGAAMLASQRWTCEFYYAISERK